MLKDRANSVDYTYKCMHNNVSLLVNFIVADNICHSTERYYTQDSIDLSDHIPLFFELKCIVQTVTSESTPVMNSEPVWGLSNAVSAQLHHTHKYQFELNKQ